MPYRARRPDLGLDETVLCRMQMISSPPARGLLLTAQHTCQWHSWTWLRCLLGTRSGCGKSRRHLQKNVFDSAFVIM